MSVDLLCGIAGGVAVGFVIGTTLGVASLVLEELARRLWRFGGGRQ